eukprot:CAMPEP_0182480080 /NCGR_PEP_ID=MMETSP1319-20130603/35230_1 /TAXON_ID=172717 /ORGANISM="Bolidomonas pacifica, Strain RCC208" /LENGTH=192 /DNA_ID=CAMNT_0024681547 /DNA_START=173 /DNA_END=748 /DNA_ORIENTATION=-
MTNNNKSLTAVPSSNPSKSSSSPTPSPYIPSKFLTPLLPDSYPASVSPSYAPYSSRLFVSSVSSSTLMVLSTHSLLLSLYPSTPLLPAASAALTWIIKDGLGQLTGIIATSLLSKRRTLDTSPKTTRFLSSLVLDCAFYMELCAPLYPALFLPIACASNCLKNVSWLASSASRAGIHANLCLGNNLADVTAK